MSVELRHAMLFAAGLGTRLMPLTKTTPKPLVKVGGKALIDHALERFGEAGLERVVVNTHHLAGQIDAHLSAHTWPFELKTSHEDVLLETGGGIARALPMLGAAPFVSANADAIWIDRERPALARLAEAFDAERMDALLLLHPLERAVGYRGPGNFSLTDDGQLSRAMYAPYVFTGVQVLHPRLFGGRAATPWSLRELYNAAERGDGRLTRMYGLVHDGDWVHVGSPEELAEADAFFSR